MPPEKTVFIVNGLNFTARMLAKRLLLEGSRVLLSGNPSDIELLKLSSIKSDKNFSFTASTDFEKALKDQKGIQIIYFFPENFLNDSFDPVRLKVSLEYAQKNNARIVLISRLNVYQGIVSTSSVGDYFGSNEKDENKFSQIENCRYLETMSWKAHKIEGTKVCIARLGVVFGYGMDFIAPSPIEEMLKDILDNKPIRIFGNGLEKHFLIHIDDAIELLVKCGAMESSVGKIVPIANNLPIAEIEFAYLVKGIVGKKCEIKFMPKRDAVVFVEQEDINLNKDIPFSWKPEFSLKDGVRSMLEKFGYFRPALVVSQKNDVGGESYTLPKFFRWKKSIAPINTIGGGSGESEESEGKDRKNSRKLLLPIIGALIFVTLFPAFYFLANVAGGFIFFNLAKNATGSLDFPKAERNYLRAESFFYQSLSIPIIIKTPVRLVNNGQTLQDMENFIVGYYYLSLSQVEYSEVLFTSQNVLLALNPNSGAQKVPQTELEGAGTASNLGNLYLKQSRARFLEITSPTLKILAPSNLGKNDDELENISNLFINASEILGYKEAKNYLILVQRQNEITPTGGIIESYADISIKDGKITGVEIDDIENVNQKITGTPPYQIPTVIKDLAKRDKFDIRDAFWSPNFPVASQQFIGGFKAATGKDYSGIFAINTSFVATLLSEIGEVYIPSYNVNINNTNIWDKQLAIQNESINGGTQKKTLLTALTHKIISMAFEKNWSSLQLLEDTANDFKRKNILVYLPQTQYISDNNWDGKNINLQNSDYLMVIDTNLGGTKTNPFIERSVSYKIEKTEDPEVLKGTATILYKHTGESNAWPIGSYINFVRIYTPQNSKLQSAFLTTGLNGKKNNILNGVQITKEQNLTTFGTGFELKAKNEIALEISYLITKQNLISSDGLYKLQMIKQPGYLNETISLTVNDKKEMQSAAFVEDKTIVTPIF